MVVFIALELEQAVKDGIHRYVRDVIRPLCREGRWVDSSNYHMTLKYIGTVEDKQVNDLNCILGDAAGRQSVFRLTTGRTGVFGGQRDGRARVLWLGTEGDTNTLRGLREYIENRAVGMGFNPDNRFTPHITLARDVLLTRQPDDIKRMDTAVINVKSVSLMESRMEKGKRVYIPLAVYKFSRTGWQAGRVLE